MAVENKIVTHNITSDTADKAPAAYFGGSLKRAIAFNFEVKAADNDGSIYRIGRISPQAIITSVKIMCDAITGGIDYDLGFYKSLDLDGSVIVKDCVVNGQTMASALAVLTEVFAPAQADLGKRAYELASLTAYNQYGAFDLAWTANTVGTADGTLAGIVEFIEGV